MPRIIASEIFDKWGGDAIGPLPSSNGHQFIVLWTDYFSKWIAGRAIRAVSAENITKSLLQDVILEHGIPKEIVTDRGSGYSSYLMTELLNKWKIRGIKSTSYNPRSNGQAERSNQTVVNIIAKLCMEYGSRLNEILPYAICNVNTTINRSSGYSPFYLKFGVEPRSPIVMDRTFENDLDPFQVLKRRKEALESLKRKRIEVLEMLQMGYDRRRLERERSPKLRKYPLIEGSKVLLWRSELDKQWSGKLESKWKGPYLIIRVYDNGTYDLGELDGRKYRSNPVSGRFIREFRERDNPHQG